MPVGSPKLTPVTLLCGFLGSGKTTLLRHALARSRQLHTAVIVNDFGDSVIDHGLIRTVEENCAPVGGGCGCCTKRPNLAATMADLLDQSERQHIAIDRLLIETSGLADPAPIAFTIATDPVLRRHFSVDLLVATVDAMLGLQELERWPEIKKQVQVADRLIITKTDLVERAVVDQLKDVLTKINPLAEVHEGCSGQIDPATLLSGLDLRQDVRYDECACVHSLAGSSSSLSLVIEDGMDWVRFGIWFSMLLHAHGPRLLRVKGVLASPGGDAVSINAVQHVMHAPEHLPDWPASKLSKLEFIAHDLDLGSVARSFAVFQTLEPRGVNH